jgi:hypothetical protein
MSMNFVFYDCREFDNRLKNYWRPNFNFISIYISLWMSPKKLCVTRVLWKTRLCWNGYHSHQLLLSQLWDHEILKFMCLVDWSGFMFLEELRPTWREYVSLVVFSSCWLKLPAGGEIFERFLTPTFAPRVRNEPRLQVQPLLWQNENFR